MSKRQLAMSKTAIGESSYCTGQGLWCWMVVVEPAESLVHVVKL